MKKQTIYNIVSENCHRAMIKANKAGYIGYYEHVYEFLNEVRNRIVDNGKYATLSWLKSLTVIEELKPVLNNVIDLFN